MNTVTPIFTNGDRQSMCHIKYFVAKAEVKQISTPISKLP